MRLATAVQSTLKTVPLISAPRRASRPFGRALVVAAVALVAAAVEAQDSPAIERGFKPERSFQVGDIDQINLFNGSLSLAIPLGQRYPMGLGAELSYGLTLYYNSQVWDYISAEAPPYSTPPIVNQAWPARTANAGLGWRLSMGEFWDETSIGAGACRMCYVGPDGAQHKFEQRLHPDVADDSTGTWYTVDGTYLRLRRSAREIDFPNGEIHRFDASGRLIQMRDRLGNTVNVSYGADAWTINDGIRIQTVNLVNVAHYGKAVGSVVLRTFDGGTATYRFDYSQVKVPRSCLDTDPETGKSMTLPLLTKIVLPDGSSYQMPTTSYDLTGTASPCDGLDYWVPLEGLLTDVRLPTRGHVGWTYQAYNFPVPIEGDEGEDPLWLSKAPGVATRTLTNAGGSALGTWTYEQLLPGGQNATESITQVSTPLGDRTDHYFRVGQEVDPRYGLPFSTAETAPTRSDLFRSKKFYDCASNGTGCALKRTTYVKYATDSPFPGGPERNARLQASLTRYHDDANRWAAQDLSNFDGLGHYRTSVFSGNFPGVNARTETTHFNPNRGTYPGSFVMPATAAPWVLGTYSYRSTTEGGRTYRSDHCFDEATGFMKRSRIRKATTGAIGTNDVVTTFARSGSQRKITERWYGGDLAPVGTGALCGLGLGAETYRLDHTFRFGSLEASQYSNSTGGMVLKTVDRTIDSSTGLPSRESDPSGVSTSFEYDGMGRITEVKPAQDARVVYTYVAPISGKAKVKIRRYPDNSSANPLTDEEIVFDALGRLLRERRRMAGGAWARRVTRHDAMSHVTNASPWQADGPITAWTRYRDYDPFGRPGYIDPPEGSDHRVRFAYTGDRVVSRTSKIGTALAGGTVSEASVKVTERFDRHGRLYQVVDGTGTTTYSHDPAGRITRVSLPGQVRTFGYDGRGFMTREQLPEKGAAGNGTVTYSRFDALGNVGSRSDGPMSVDYIYDRAGRLKRVKEPGWNGEDLKVFTYGSGTWPGDRSAGKVKTADRYNRVAIGDTNYTVLIRETYTYGGRSGRVSQRDTQMWLNGAAAESFTQSFDAYDELGNLTSLGYPECTSATCRVPAPRTVSFAYQDGRLTSVAGWASPITYHPNGLMASVAHANGVTLTQTNDPWSRPRLRAIQTSGARNPAGTAAANWTSGTYVYDGEGNITQIGSGRFVYDTLSRLVSARFTTGLAGGATANRTQSYSYDTPGNRIATTTNGVRINAPASASTNRLTGAVSYDAAGNLTSWNGNTYKYDRFGRMWSSETSGGQNIHLYTADDERIWVYNTATLDSMWTLRDLAGKVLREYQSGPWGWKVARDYVYREGQLLGAATPSGAHHFHLDHLGSVRLITTNGGRRVAFHTFFPNGQEATSPTQDTERMKFAGHERDLGVTTGANPTADDLDSMHARFYNPQISRFLAVDPGRDWNPSKPQTWNLYAYARNNPLKYVDPDGRETNMYPTADKGALPTDSVSPQRRSNRRAWNKAGTDGAKLAVATFTFFASAHPVTRALSLGAAAGTFVDSFSRAKFGESLGAKLVGDIDLGDGPGYTLRIRHDVHEALRTVEAVNDSMGRLLSDIEQIVKMEANGEISAAEAAWAVEEISGVVEEGKARSSRAQQTIQLYQHTLPEFQ